MTGTSSSAASEEAAEVAYPDSGPMSAGADFEFLDYLISNELYRDAQTLMRATPYAHSDTLWYMRGRSELSNGEFAPAASAFGRVSPGAALYDKSFFYGIVSRARASRTWVFSLSVPPKTASVCPSSVVSKLGLMAEGMRMPRLKRFFRPEELMFCQV